MYIDHIKNFRYEDFGKKGELFEINGRRLNADSIEKLEIVFARNMGEYPKVTITTKNADILPLVGEAK